MQTREIPSHEWVPFLDQFSRRHQGAQVAIEVFGESLGALREAASLPLVGVSVDLIDGGDNEQIEVMAGGPAGPHLLHAVTRPSGIQLAQDERGEDQALQITSADGTSTLLRLCH